MANQTYHIIIPADAAGAPQIDATFGRITVLLGTNGTGKSKACKRLTTMSTSFGGSERPIIYMEGGRVINNLPSALSYDYQTFSEFGTFTKASQTFRQHRLSGLALRVKHPFYLLERRGEEAKSRHSDRVTEWIKSGKVGPCPEVEKNPLTDLFDMFSTVFPDITIRMEGEPGKQLLATKNNQSYPISDLSDGERQVLWVLADIALNAEDNSLIIADEPELNLNPQLASRLWDTLENNFPNSVFVYATHNISFAMRPSVNKIIALSGKGEPALQVESIADIKEEEMREFLGAIPAILAQRAAILVEGGEASFDRGFYAWLLDRPEVTVVPLGSCHEVYTATTRKGIWKELAPSVRLVGVIDRDYRADDTIQRYKSACLVLDYHEAESYLCHPQVFSAVAAAIGTAEAIPSTADVENLIIEYFQNEMFAIAVKRTSDRAQVNLSVSLPRKTVLSGITEQQLCDLVGKAADQEAERSKDKIGAQATTTMLKAELRECREALERRDIEAILKLAPGKELLAQLSPRAGCADTPMLTRAVYKHLRAEDFEPLGSLKGNIITTFA